MLKRRVETKTKEKTDKKCSINNVNVKKYKILLSNIIYIFG